MYVYVLREAANTKRVLLLMAWPLRPNPPPPSSLMVVEILDRWKKRLQKKFFFLKGPALYPHPPFNGPAIKKKNLFLRLSLHIAHFIKPYRDPVHL